MPLGLQWAGWLAPSYRYEGGALWILPRAVELPPLLTTIALCLAQLAIVLTSSLLIARVRDELLHAERRWVLHSWHLRSLGRQTTVRQAPCAEAPEAGIAPSQSCTRRR